MKKEIEMQNIINANAIIKELKFINENIEELEAEADFEIKKIKEALALKKTRLESKIKYNKEQIMLCCESIDMKETKTMKKKILLDGTIQINKAVEKMVVDDEKLMKWAKTNKPELIETKEIKKIKWAELKKDLEIVDGAIIDKNTGEFIDKDVIGIVKDEEKLEIKF
ncbi:MAG: host-nuclease inhibitor Gam family protein [Sarcina sp.]